jgi:hypothetical protein
VDNKLENAGLGQINSLYKILMGGYELIYDLVSVGWDTPTKKLTGAVPIDNSPCTNNRNIYFCTIGPLVWK